MSYETVRTVTKSDSEQVRTAAIAMIGTKRETPLLLVYSEYVDSSKLEKKLQIGTVSCGMTTLITVAMKNYHD